jgi:glycosyltransferase involved in cell wall biosynthesis
MTFALNTDGLEWQRDKWGWIGKNYYKASEYISKWICPNLVSDSQGIHDYYKKRFNVNSTIIAYGANSPESYNDNEENIILKSFNLEKGKYFFQVTRFEPENNPLLAIKAFMKTKTDYKYCLVGGGSYKSNYAKQIQDIANRNQNVVLPGFIYEKKILDVLWKNCFAYIHGNGVGGTNPALLQAMAAGQPIISLDCSFNRETLNHSAIFFKRSLSEMILALEKIICLSNQDRDNLISKNLQRIQEHYTWESITEKYESFFKKIIEK